MTPAMTPAKTIESVYDAFNRGDIAHIIGLVALKATWRQPKTLPWGGDYTGPEGATQFFNKLGATMQTVAFQARENISVGNEVFSFGYYEGRSIQTGKTGGANWMFRWSVVDGKIVAYDSYLDTAALVAALA